MRMFLRPNSTKLGREKVWLLECDRPIHDYSTYLIPGIIYRHSWNLVTYQQVPGIVDFSSTNGQNNVFCLRQQYSVSIIIFILRLFFFFLRLSTKKDGVVSSMIH